MLSAARNGRTGPDPARARAEIEEVRNRVRRIQDDLRTLPDHACLRDHAAALLSLLDRWQLPSRLRWPEGSASGNDSDFLARATAAALARDQAAFSALEEACAAMADGRIDIALVGGVAAQSNFLVRHHFARIEPPDRDSVRRHDTRAKLDQLRRDVANGVPLAHQ